MIKTIKGNVLDIERGIIVHGCNSHGVMGAGIALQIKERFPEAFHAYQKSNLKLGYISVVEVAKDKMIVNAITQKSTGIGKQVSYDAIEDCFIRIRELMNNHELFGLSLGLPLCFPMLGAGLGGGNWNIIEKIIDEIIPDSIEKHLYVL
jgi:O-acetyl-ADP-ribose deacetylase (regulator of RNase III)